MKALKVEVPDICRNALAECLASCPASLDSCYIGAWGNYGLYIWLCQAVQHTLTERLRCLMKLKLHMCRINNEGAITCLQTLTSLSISRSEIGEGLQDVTRLTNLKCLELANCLGHGGIFGRDESSSRSEWTTFVA